MNVIVSLMAAGAKKNFSKEEFRRIRKEADAHYRRLVSENKDAPKALKQHTGMNIFPAIAVYKTLVRHGMEKEAATDVVRQFFVKICGIMFKPVSWYQHIGGNYHRYPAGMVKNSLRDFSPDAGFEYRMPEKVNPAVARFDIVSTAPRMNSSHRRSEFPLFLGLPDRINTFLLIPVDLPDNCDQTAVSGVRAPFPSTRLLQRVHHHSAPQISGQDHPEGLCQLSVFS